MQPLEIALVAALAVTQALDWYSSRTGLKMGRVEQNPVARWFMERMGVDGFFAAKTVIVTGIGYWIVGPYSWLVALLIVFYAGVVAYNWKSL